MMYNAIDKDRLYAILESRFDVESLVSRLDLDISDIIEAYDDKIMIIIDTLLTPEELSYVYVSAGTED